VLEEFVDTKISAWRNLAIQEGLGKQVWNFDFRWKIRMP
jgi:hypothetical protein